MAEVLAAPSLTQNLKISHWVSWSLPAETLWEKELIPEKASIQEKNQLSKDQNPHRQRPCWLGGGGGENRGTTLPSVQQMPFREAVTESPVLGSRSRGVGMPRAAGPGASAWSTSVTERSLLLRVVPGRRQDRHLMGQLGDNAAQGRELTSYHFIGLYQPFRGRRQNQTTMLT